MAKYEVKLPQMGESVAEATITNWLKEVGDKIALDESLVEVATDKVDSEVPSEVEGVLTEILFKPDAVVKVGQTIAIIEVEEGEVTETVKVEKIKESKEVTEVEKQVEQVISQKIETHHLSSGKFLSPLVRSIAKKEGISLEELETIKGTGSEGRITKNDVLNHLNSSGKEKRNTTQDTKETPEKIANTVTPSFAKESNKKTVEIPIRENSEIIEMSRMGKLVAQHMTDSKRISAHVQSFIEIDVTNIVTWRNKVKGAFLKRESEKITFTPIFMQIIAKVVKEYPMVNISVQGDKIIKHSQINLGMAAALPDGNLIVPVIKNADCLNLIGMTKAVNDLATRARNNQLKPDEIQGGTYTVTNVGSFGSITGTPIINQPQVAILALGAIVKKPAVIETDEGDFIGIRHKMIVAHSYDHRVVNGAMGGMFLKTLKSKIEAWDVNADF